MGENWRMHSGADVELLDGQMLSIKDSSVVLIQCKRNKLGKIKTHRPSGF